MESTIKQKRRKIVTMVLEDIFILKQIEIDDSAPMMDYSEA